MAQASPAPAASRVVVAKFYRAGLFARAASVHGVFRGYSVRYASLPQPSVCRDGSMPLLGRIVSFRLYNPVRRVWSGTLEAVVADGSACRDVYRHMAVGPGIEVDYSTAVEFGFSREGKTVAIVEGVSR